MSLKLSPGGNVDLTNYYNKSEVDGKIKPTPAIAENSIFTGNPFDKTIYVNSGSSNNGVVIDATYPIANALYDNFNNYGIDMTRYALMTFNASTNYYALTFNNIENVKQVYFITEISRCNKHIEVYDDTNTRIYSGTYNGDTPLDVSSQCSGKKVSSVRFALADNLGQPVKVFSMLVVGLSNAETQGVNRLGVSANTKLTIDGVEQATSGATIDDAAISTTTTYSSSKIDTDYAKKTDIPAGGGGGITDFLKVGMTAQYSITTSNANETLPYNKLILGSMTGVFDATTHKYTAPSDGLYRIGAALYLSNSGQGNCFMSLIYHHGGADTEVRIDGDNLTLTTTYNLCYLNGSTTIPMNTGDTVYAFIHGQAGAIVNANDYETFMTFERVGDLPAGM